MIELRSRLWQMIFRRPHVINARLRTLNHYLAANFARMVMGRATLSQYFVMTVKIDRVQTFARVSALLGDLCRLRSADWARSTTARF